MALRIKELGFVSGTKVKVVNKSVLKHCAVVLVRDCFVALRENAIAKIMVRSLWDICWLETQTQGNLQFLTC